ncbi:MAG: hypothetical protein R3C05_04305 [Pirellulaceae bacterium]
MRTLRYQISYYDPCHDPVNASYSTPGIYIFWHEYIPFMFYLRGHNDVSMLLSQHRDAEAAARDPIRRLRKHSWLFDAWRRCRPAKDVSRGPIDES